MGSGMASYIEASSSNNLNMIKWEDYDLYCHFVAGLVGEGLSRLFAESGMERVWIGDQLTLSNHMGLFLQKTNIIRDYAEDCAEGRHFWPKECWAAPGADFTSQAQVAKGIVETSKGSRRYRPQGKDGERAMFVLSTMLLDALRHSTKALDYLSLIREQSIFNFCAIPQVMAIATINVMMTNPDVFKRNVKIRKSQAVEVSQQIRRATMFLSSFCLFRLLLLSAHLESSKSKRCFICLFRLYSSNEAKIDTKRSKLSQMVY